MLRLSEGEIPQLAAIEALLNAAAAGDVPVNRATALDLAVKHGRTWGEEEIKAHTPEADRAQWSQ